jgi:propanol-preferring alcohol dehydrogenase
MKNLRPGGRLVINAIRKEEVDKDQLLELDYARHLWEEKEVKSVANVARSDVIEFVTIAADMDIRPDVKEFALEEANAALVELKAGGSRGAKILKIS